MESSYDIRLAGSELEALATNGELPEGLLTAAVHAHADQIGYMLQVYHPREKVSQVTVVPGSISAQPSGTVNLQLHYVLEEYNACSAIDTEKKEHMRITIEPDRVAGLLHLKGEHWPEL